MNPRTTIGWLALVTALGACAAPRTVPAPAPAAAARASSSATTIVILVRHAEKAATGGNDPDLTPLGRRRADELATTLRNAGVDAIVVSERRRTHQTAAPLAAALGIVPDTVGLGATVPEHAAAVARRIRESHAGRTVLVVGHSNTVPPIIAALGGPELPEICDAVHSGLYVVILRGNARPGLIQSRYGPSDPGAPGGCPGGPPR